MNWKSLIILSLIGLSFTSGAYCQENDIQTLRKETLEEGLFLFKLEKASWIATDILLKDHSTLQDQINGYLSYDDSSTTKTIFWDSAGKVIFTATFDNITAGNKGTANNDKRSPTSKESELIKLRDVTMNMLMENKDGFFFFYEDTSPNLIPFIRSNERTVFILTGSRKNELLIGNDYKLVFDDKNEIISKVKLHNSLIRLDQGDKKSNEVGSVHNHVIEDQPFMTSTDICTFMLYKDAFKFTRHVVISEKGYVHL